MGLNDFFKRYVIFIGLIMSVIDSIGQSIVVKGKVTDAETGEGMPLVNVVNKASGKGTTTNFEGFYELHINSSTDSLVCFYVGYKERSKALKGFTSQTIDFQLAPDAGILDEFTVTAGENPAFWIIRKVIANKDKNDLRRLNSYEYESFTKNELHIDKLSEKFRQRKAFRKIVQIFDSLKTIAGEDGKPVLPVFVSETMSDYYFNRDPKKTKEVLKAVKVVGVGFDEDSPVTQLIGSSFQQYNFYRNWLTILNKEFISPIAEGWNGYYEYTLQDSLMYKGNRCYKIDFKPKRPQDLAFKGTMWITDTTFALKQIDVAVGKESNINYIQKIKIQQELIQTQAGPWLPVKTRVLINVSEISENSPGVLAKFYVSNKNFIVDAPKPHGFFDMLLETTADAKEKSDDYWTKNRHDSITNTEKNVLKMIDSVRNMPVVKGYVDIVNIAVNGHKRFKYFDVGPFLLLYARNSVEGNRFRLGARSNVGFSKHWLWKGYLAYGTLDNRFKYNLGASYIFSNRHWTLVTFERKEDYEQAGIPTEFIDNNLFLAGIQWGSLRGAYYTRQNNFTFQVEPKKDFTQKIILKTKTFEPHSSYNFSYYEINDNKDSIELRNFETSEVILETRFAKDEIFIQSDLSRKSLGTRRAPIYTFRFTQGLKGALAGDFNYSKFNFSISHILRMGSLGRLYYDVNVGRILGNVPYPLLEVHMGNESYYYASRAFNLMNYFEFVSDQYVSLRCRQYFEGLLFNRIPLVKKLKWRLLATGNLVYGGVSDRNMQIMPPKDYVTMQKAFYTLNKMPYIELGYGIENIFKIFRIDFFHRITYNENAGARNFGFKFSAQFNL